MFIAKWSQRWFDIRIGKIIALSEKESISENIAKLTLNEIRKLKNVNFAKLIRDKEIYAKQREENYTKINSLTRKMIKSAKAEQKK